MAPHRQPERSGLQHQLHLHPPGQLWQGPQSSNGTSSQYLYCDSTHPHQLTGLYSLGSTCSSQQGQTYASTYDAWGNVTGRTVNGTSATLSYDGLDHLTSWNTGSAGQEQYIYDAGGERVLRRSTSAGSTTMTVYAFGLEEHRYGGTGVNQGNTYYYNLAGLLIGEFDGTNTNMYLTDALGSVLETISAAPNSAAVQGNQVYGPYGTSRYQFCPSRISDFWDFTYQVQMTIIRGDQGGIGFRQDTTQYPGPLSYFHISTTGQYWFDVYTGSPRTLSSGFSPAIHMGLNQPNLLAVVAQGSTIDLYINLVHIAKVIDSSAFHGQIGVIANAISNPTEVVFRNARVWTL